MRLDDGVHRRSDRSRMRAGLAQLIHNLNTHVVRACSANSSSTLHTMHN
jgi:hypothetical protein